MSILQNTATALVTHVLGGDPAGRTSEELADMAGQYLMTLRSWNWANGIAVTADLTASQAYVELPTAFQGFVTIPRIVGTSWTYMEMVSVETIERLRQTTTTSTGTPIYFALSYDMDTDGVPVPRLELYPTPGTTVADGISYYYRRGWASWPDADTTPAQIPPWLDNLYIETLRMVCRGWEDDLQDPLQMQRLLEALKMSPAFTTAAAIDDTLQASYGQVKGGVADDFAAGWTRIEGDGSPS